jgi:hypothetical protein
LISKPRLATYWRDEDEREEKSETSVATRTEHSPLLNLDTTKGNPSESRQEKRKEERS